ncbi:MAG TPA: D-alanyl-D-alanine carboxypeptidase/D-alanyl-D-alanine-endopeptidase [Thermoleophilaceae bacterium]
MRRFALAAALGAGLLVPAGAAHASSIQAQLAAAMRGAGSHSGAYVRDATSGQVLFSSRASTPRILASNTKLFTSSAILARLGPDATFPTELEGDGTSDPETGIFTGDIYLRGGGDPTFGTSSFIRKYFGSGASIQALVKELEATGITRIDGRIIGDESRFDSLRGIPDSGYAFDRDLGAPLSALTYDRGLANLKGTALQGNPPLFAAQQVAAALKGRHIRVTAKSAVGTAPSNAKVLASVQSPPLSTILKLQNKESDNFFAEMLLKDLGSSSGSLGTTARGAAAAVRYAARLGSRVTMADGSGLDRRDRAAPKEVVDLLEGERRRDPDEFNALLNSLPIAGRDGTLVDRMRHGSARGRCHAKTGTLSDVSALSGYCFARGGDVIEFSLLMNRANVNSAHAVQDRMANAIAAYRGSASATAALKTTLDMNSAKTVAGAFASDCGACMDQVTDCARLNSRRIDCVVADQASCSEVVSTRLFNNGYLYTDTYPCKSQTPPTAAAQVQQFRPGGHPYQPLTPATFEFAADVFPKHLPYPRYPVRHYRGLTSQRANHVDIWTDRKHDVLGVSGASFNAPCFHGADFVDLGRRKLTRHGTVLNARRAKATASRPAFTLHARLVGKRFTGSFRLLQLSCQKKPISFSAKLVGKPGF